MSDWRTTDRLTTWPAERSMLTTSARDMPMRKPVGNFQKFGEKGNKKEIKSI